LAANFGTGEVFLEMLYFFFFIIWIWLLIVVFADIFRSHDLSGWGKALWTLFVIVLPYLGVFVYLIARGHKMHEHAGQTAGGQTVGTGRATTPSSADEIARLADLRDRGEITDAEFQQAKAKALA